MFSVWNIDTHLRGVSDPSLVLNLGGFFTPRSERTLGFFSSGDEWVDIFYIFVKLLFNSPKKSNGIGDYFSLTFSLSYFQFWFISSITQKSL